MCFKEQVVLGPGEKEKFGWLWGILPLPKVKVALKDISVALKRQGGSLKRLPLAKL